MESLSLAKSLINIESVTPNDNGCQDILIERLKKIGFMIETINSNGVSNFWARKGTEAPLIIFSGHTDVVPAGAVNRWKTNPFEAVVKEEALYGRGAADMKAALAAMVVAVENFVKKHPDFKGSIGFMITSDEEGDATDGTKKIVEYCKKNNIAVDYCIIGEASSMQHIGDSIKIGRRGSLHGYLKVIGKQGHIAYPQLADNPIHKSFRALDALTQIQWDEGDEHFTPTSLQIYNINADTGANNVIPGSLTARFNFRYSPANTAETLQERVHKVFDDHNLNYDIEWNLMSQPFLSPRGHLIAAVTEAIHEICGIETHPNTTGGTSDGRFISSLGCEIVELGAVSKCIHQVNEYIEVKDLNTLTMLYERVLEKLSYAGYD